MGNRGVSGTGFEFRVSGFEFREYPDLRHEGISFPTSEVR